MTFPSFPVTHKYCNVSVTKQRDKLYCAVIIEVCSNTNDFNVYPILLCSAPPPHTKFVNQRNLTIFRPFLGFYASVKLRFGIRQICSSYCTKNRRIELLNSLFLVLEATTK